MIIAKHSTLALSCIFTAIPALAANGSIWQTSTDIKVHLDLRSKFARDTYFVKFIVTDTKNTYSLDKKVKGDQFVTAIFPDDFHAETKDGNYKWQAIVSNKPILTGWFTYKSIGQPDKSGWRNKQITMHVDSK